MGELVRRSRFVTAAFVGSYNRNDHHLFSVFFSSLRLATAIVCIGLSLVLAGLWLELWDKPMRLLAYFGSVGLGVYTAFVLVVIRSFEVTQVVPDRVREALDTLSEGLLVMDEHQRIVLANRSFRDTVEMTGEQLLGRRAGSLSWDCSESATAEDLPWVRAVRQAKPQTEQLMRYRMPNGTLRYFSINSTPVQSPTFKLRGALATFRDVTQVEQHRAELQQMLAMLRNSRDEFRIQNRELQILVTQDALTGCLNRRGLVEAMEASWRAAQHDRSPLSCLMIDNDHFKSVNDTFGHHVGDEVLRLVSKLLKQHFETPTLVCRYGGEEFCIVLPGATLSTAVDQAEAVRQAISMIRLKNLPRLRLTASIGVSERNLGAGDPQELIHQADQSLYFAKENGRNCVISFSQIMDNGET